MDTRIITSFPADLLAAIDDWRSASRPIPNRSEAVRQLVRMSLRAAPEKQ